MELWHNPRCTKSRQAKELLDDQGVEYTERRYLDRPPTAEELDAVLTAMGKEPWEVTRMGESVADELGLQTAPKDRQQWIETMVANPILIERPILVTDDGRAAVGRPTEAIAELL
jgi:arsenate reductase (glutaredoxin)